MPDCPGYVLQRLTVSLARVEYLNVDYFIRPWEVAGGR